MNDFSNRRDADLMAVSRTLANGLVEGRVPVDPALAVAVKAASERFEAEIHGVDHARAALRAEIGRREEARAGLLNLMSTTASGLYHDASVTDAALMGVGLAPRPPHAPRPLSAHTVEGFRMAIDADLGLRFLWERGENGRSTIFELESLRDGVWTGVALTTRTRVRVTEHPPGVEAWFRVTAHTSTTRAEPSAAVCAYPGGTARRAA